MPEFTYQYRLYPTPKQAADIMHTCSGARYLYNKLLEDRTKHFRENREWKPIDRSCYLEKPFLRQTDPKALQFAENNLKRAFRRFFYDKNPERYRPECLALAARDRQYELLETDLYNYPRFKRKKASKESYSTCLQDLNVENGRINLPCIGKVKIRLHRQIPKDAEQLYCTVLHKASGRYFLLIHLKTPDIPEKAELNKPLGVVLVKGKLAVRSDGEEIVYYHQEDSLSKQIRSAKKALARRTPGSKRYEKMRIHLARLYEHRVNQRRDQLHKASRQIANAGDTVYMQTPDVTYMIASLPKGSKARSEILDEAWWTFSYMVRHKVQAEGKRFWSVPRAFPVYSLCSACDHLEKGVSQCGTEWICPKCGHKQNLHLNAAINLEKLGLQYISVSKG